LNQSKSEFFETHFAISSPQKQNKKEHPGAKAVSGAACAIGAFIGLHGHKLVSKNSSQVKSS
jgi:hypothetical protein